MGLGILTRFSSPSVMVFQIKNAVKAFWLQIVQDISCLIAFFWPINEIWKFAQTKKITSLLTFPLISPG